MYMLRSRRLLGLDTILPLIFLLFAFCITFVGGLWYVEAIEHFFGFMVGKLSIFHTIYHLHGSVFFHILNFYFEVFSFLLLQTLCWIIITRLKLRLEVLNLSSVCQQFYILQILFFHNFWWTILLHLLIVSTEIELKENISPSSHASLCLWMYVRMC